MFSRRSARSPLISRLRAARFSVHGAAGIAVLLTVAPEPLAALRIEVLRSVGGLPPHVVGTFEEAINFQQAANGMYYVFDRRGHTVHTIDPSRTIARKAVEIGAEQGRIIQPTGFDIAPDGRFVVADVPRAQQRVQTFDPFGERLGGFFLPGQPAARIIFGNMMLNGAGSVQHTGESLLISHPESGALFTEYSLAGYASRSIGNLRATGFESDRDLHVAMNAGLPLVDPTGGFYYVFIAGTPTFRKYDANGRLVFERYIQGREIDDYLAAQPNQWPRRRVQDREVPFVTPVIRAAAVDPTGQLWISLGVPYTYVYDAQGDKVRAIQFQAAGTISPTSLFFNQRGRLLVTPGCYEFDPQQR
jgi:hypothetical protein